MKALKIGFYADGLDFSARCSSLEDVARFFSCLETLLAENIRIKYQLPNSLDKYAPVVIYSNIEGE